MPPKAKAVGIDLGTTYSCVATVLNGKVEVIANDFGHRTTPSMVAFLDGEDEAVVGDAAFSQAPMYPTNVFYDAKRVLGRGWEDATLQADIPSWPFELFRAKTGKVKVRCEQDGEEKVVTPEEISAAVLMKMKQTAESYLNKPVREAVITVPAYFSDRQIRATREAAMQAKLRVLRILPEPSAAALAYAYDRQHLEAPDLKNVLIYDLGGGTFDVTVAAIESCKVRVKGKGGDTHLGGQDFDQRVLKHVAAEIKAKTGKDILADKKKTRRLLNLCERAKRDLSAMAMTQLDVMSLTGEDLEVKLSRAKFEDLNKDLLSKTVDCVRAVLEEVSVAAEDIEEVILVGGSTRMPCVPRMLQAVFPGRAVSRTVNPDEVVAHGAALLAAHLAGEDGDLLAKVLLHDVTPISIGLGEEDGSFCVIVPRGSPIPVRVDIDFLTVYDRQENMSLLVYQGERKVAIRNQFIGEYTVSRLPPRVKGLRIEIALAVDADGVLSVEAKHPSTGRWEGCVLGNLDCSSLGGGEGGPQAAGPASSLDAADSRHQDQLELYRLQARFSLNRFLVHSKARVKEGKPRELLDDASSWLEAHAHATKFEFQQKLAAVRLDLRNCEAAERKCEKEESGIATRSSRASKRVAKTKIEITGSRFLSNQKKPKK